jgi:exodeoxyribonuclease VIII
MREVKKLSDDYIKDDESYFADSMYVTNSMLKQLMTGSTMKLEHYLNMEHKESESLLVGSAFHCYLLEPDDFDKRYVYAPKIDKRTKAGKEMYAEFLKKIGNRKAIPAHYEFVFECMHDNITRNVNANHLIQEAEGRETIHFWEDVKTGLKCKGKVDIEGKDYLVDIKTTSKGADHESFNKFVNDYKITQQAAFYLNGTQKKDFYFIMVELKAPFGVGIYKMSEQAIEFGNKQIDSTIELYKKYINEDLSSDLNGGNIVIV